MKAIFFCLMMFCFAKQTSAQSIHLTKPTGYHNWHGIVVPGINPDGDKLLQITFTRFKLFKPLIVGADLALVMESGDELKLSRPSKIHLDNSKRMSSWAGVYPLTNEQIDRIKKEQIRGIRLLVDHKPIVIANTADAAKQLQEMVAVNF